MKAIFELSLQLVFQSCNVRHVRRETFAGAQKKPSKSARTLKAKHKNDKKQFKKAKEGCFSEGVSGMHGGRMTREQSFSVSLSSGEEQKKSQAELESARRSLAQAQFAIAELRVALAEAHERGQELEAELAAQQLATLPGIGGAQAMMSNLGEMPSSLDRPQLRSARFDQREREEEKQLERAQKRERETAFFSSHSSFLSRSALRFASVMSAGRAEAHRSELLCRWPDLRVDRTLPALPEKEPKTTTSTTTTGGSAKKKETVDVALGKEGGLIGLVRQSMLALALAIVVLRLLVLLLLQ